MCRMPTNSSRVLWESRTIQIIEPICSTAGSPISITNETMPGFLTTSVPEGVELMFLPPYSPQIQPAERLWPLTNEPIVNEYFETLDELDEVLAERCRILADDQDQIRAHTLFEWWPQHN